MWHDTHRISRVLFSIWSVLYYFVLQLVILDSTTIHVSQLDMTKKEPEEINLSDGESIKELESNNSRLIYKHNNGTLEVHRESLKCLSADEYLNDTVIQFYLAYLLKEVCKEEVTAKVHIFDSIFHAQLEKVFKAETVDEEKLLQIRKWYEGVNIFDKQFLIFPVCSGQHWFALVACYPEAVRSIGVDHSNGRDPVNTSQRQIPGIIVMDSLNLKKRTVTAQVRDFLDYEWRDRRKDIKRFSYSDLKDYFAPLPKQKNAYDCGIFMLMYIKCFLVMGPENVYKLIRKRDAESISQLKDKIDQLIEVNDRPIIKRLIEKACRDSRQSE